MGNIFLRHQRECENQGVPGGQMTTLKKIYRRGNHYKANYPNEAFRKHNEAKMLAKLKYNVDQEVQDLMPEAIEIAQKKNEKELWRLKVPHQSSNNQQIWIRNI